MTARPADAELRGRGAPPRRAARAMLALAVLPACAWFMLASLADPGPAWRVRYYPKGKMDGDPRAVEHEREVSRYWDRRNAAVPGGLKPRLFSIRYDTCLELDAPVTWPVMLVTRGRARLSVDGREVLQTLGHRRRASRGLELELAAGVHHLEVEFSPIGWGSVALLASRDGTYPKPLGGEGLALPRDAGTACPGAS